MKTIRLIAGLFLFSFIGFPLLPTSACTIFSQAIGETVLFGNNEDHYLNTTFISFTPAQSNHNGFVYLGFIVDDETPYDLPEGGMNDQGLSIDINALPATQLNAHPEKIPYPDDFYWLNYFLTSFSTVNEVINFYSTHGRDYNRSISWQLHFADATGDAVIVSVDQDGEWNFTRKEYETYLISTNWNRANPQSGENPCWRYDTAKTMLENIDHEDTLTVEAFRDILNAVHQEGEVATQYSNVFDLVNQEIYLYSNYTFETMIKFNLEDELAKGPQKYLIADLLEDSIIADTSSSSSNSSTSSSSTSVSSFGYNLATTFMVFTLIGMKIIRKRKNND
ncbi:MAG: hypothetical protein ACXAC7_01270 [Candidatus Hodarchaeales archaeon]|jgi:hypothetical protein